MTRKVRDGETPTETPLPGEGVQAVHPVVLQWSMRALFMEAVEEEVPAFTAELQALSADVDDGQLGALLAKWHVDVGWLRDSARVWLDLQSYQPQDLGLARESSDRRWRWQLALMPDPAIRTRLKMRDAQLATEAIQRAALTGRLRSGDARHMLQELYRAECMAQTFLYVTPGFEPRRETALTYEAKVLADVQQRLRAHTNLAIAMAEMVPGVEVKRRGADGKRSQNTDSWLRNSSTHFRWAVRYRVLGRKFEAIGKERGAWATRSAVQRAVRPILDALFG